MHICIYLQSGIHLHEVEILILIHHKLDRTYKYRYNVQWNLSNLDTLGIEESVLISEVS